MALTQYALEKLQHFALAATAARTENFTGATTNVIDLQGLEGDIQIILDAAAPGADGTKTLALKLEHSANGTTSFADVTGGAFTSLTTSASKQVLTINSDDLRRYIRLVTTQGAGSTYTYSVNGYGLKKYD